MFRKQGEEVADSCFLTTRETFGAHAIVSRQAEGVDTDRRCRLWLAVKRLVRDYSMLAVPQRGAVQLGTNAGSHTEPYRGQLLFGRRHE